MSVSTSKAAWNAQCGSIAAKSVLVAMADRADSETGECWPSVAVIATRCEMTERAVYKQISALEKAGFITRRKRRGTSNCYVVTPQNGEQIEHATPERSSPRPCTTFTPERSSPLNDVHPTPEQRSGLPLNDVHPTPEPRSPKPSRNHQGTINEPSQPLPFDSKAFAEIWQAWQRFRIERKARLTPSTISAQLRMLGKLNEPDAIATIETSIRNGWQGLFPDRNTKKTNGHNKSGNTGTANAGTAGGKSSIDEAREFAERQRQRIAAEGRSDCEELSLGIPAQGRP